MTKRVWAWFARHRLVQAEIRFPLIINFDAMAVVADIYAQRWQLAAALVVAYALIKFRAYWRLRAFRGPPGSGFTNFWHTRAFLEWNSHLWYDEICSKYGMCRTSRYESAMLLGRTEDVKS